MALFGISCGNERPVDRPISCRLQDYRYGDADCEASFGYAAAGAERVWAAAARGSSNEPFETIFRLFRRD